MKSFRMSGWMLVSCVLLAGIAAIQPDLVLRLANKVVNVTVFGVVGWAFSRAVFAMLTPSGNGRLEEVDPETRDAAVQGRCILIAGAMIAGALGL